MKTVKIHGLPKEAEGVHIVSKVKILRKCDGIDYAVVLLDEGIVINLLQGVTTGTFSYDAALVLLSEGETLEFIRIEVDKREVF